MIRKIVLIFSLLFPLVLLSIYFKNVLGNDFLFLHDEFLLLNKQESFNTFFTQNPFSLGTANTTVMLVTFFDRIYYFIAYFLGYKLSLVQRLLYFIKLFLLIIIPYIGFKKLSDIFSKKISEISIFAISLWYSFNTFTLIYLHGNAFSLTILISYILAPLAFYYYHKSIFESLEKTYKFKAVVLLFLISFGLYFYASFIMLLIFYTVIYTFIFKSNKFKVFKNLVLLSLLYLPFLSIQIIIPYEMFFSSAKSLNITGGETYSNLRGGFLYPLLMWFSWGIYTNWQPRNVFTFSSYFRTLPSLIAPFIIYALLLPGLLKKKKDLLFLLFFSLFLIFLFLIKGARNPFGYIYSFLLAYIAPFRVFRSPESKFGFTLTFLLSLLLMRVATSYKNKLFPILLGMVVLIQGYLIFNGTAIIGENTSNSSDRIVKIPVEYFEFSDYINKNTLPYGYIMPIPSVEFGHYRLEPHKRYIGQDILPKLTNLPFLYLSENTGISSDTYQGLSASLASEQVNKLSKFPIKYIVIRNDSNRTNNDNKIATKIAAEPESVYKNKLFTVYKTSDPSPLIQSKNATFKMINPIKYQISIKNLKNGQKLFFNQSFNPNWVLFSITNKDQLICDRYFIHKVSGVKECKSENKFIEIEELSYLFKKSVFSSSHKSANGYENSWTISLPVIKKEIGKKYYTENQDGSININLVLYYKEQSIFYTGTIISIFYLFFVLIYISISEFRKKTKLKS